MENIVELLLKQSQVHPDVLAIQDESRTLTYKELFSEVNLVASNIHQKGIVNSPIIIKVNRNIESVVSLLGVLLSNNYFIPVDEDIPFEKLSKIIEVSNAKHYISFKEDDLPLEKIDISNKTKLIDFDEFSKGFDEQNYSYVIFTSGSTGNPKGVIKNHENIISFVNNFLDTFDFIKGERIANQTPFFFDASMKDIFVSIASGSTLFVPSKIRFSLPSETVKYLIDKKITMIMWVPSILTMIAKTRTLSYFLPKDLKYVFFVGEVFQRKYLNMWIEALPSVRYFNIYGSTEVMGISLFHEIKGISENETIPTGKPIKNNKAILDDGEIVISSKQVAVGYLNEDNKKTFRMIDNEKYLYTGDYATFDKDGNIVFSSRKDYQIKHLGYRIELQEIEKSLVSLDYIDMCVASYDKKIDKIVLFVTLNKELSEPNKQIIADSKNKLQFYMVPNKVVVLDKMPLNSNGKIDRNYLRLGLEDGRY